VQPSPSHPNSAGTSRKVLDLWQSGENKEETERLIKKEVRKRRREKKEKDGERERRTEAKQNHLKEQKKKGMDALRKYKSPTR